MASQANTDNLTEKISGELPTGGAISTWNLLRHELLYYLWALMELAIITPLFLAFAPWASFWPPGLTVALFLLMMLIPFNLSRLMSTMDVRLDRQRIVLTTGLILTILVAWRLLLFSPRPVGDLGWILQFMSHLDIPENPYRMRDITIFLLVTFLWWRGISLVGRHVDITEIGFRMRFEVLLLFILVAVLAGTLLAWSVTPFILLFFFSALLAIVITRVEQLELSRTRQSFPITLRWLAVITGVAGSIVFLTGTIAGALSDESIQNTVGWFSPLWEALSHMGIAVVTTVAFLGSPLFALIEWIINLFVNVIDTAFDQGLGTTDFFTQSPFAEQLPDELMQATESNIQFPRQLLTILIMLLIILFVTLFLGRIGRALRRTTSSEYQTINPLNGSVPLPRLGLGQRLLDRIGAFQRWRAAASVRYLYRQMCTTAAGYGYPRSESETPYEYLATLFQAWPDGKKESEMITEAYVKVHYGEFPENKEQLTVIAASWKRLESMEPAETAPANNSPLTQRREK